MQVLGFAKSTLFVRFSLFLPYLNNVCKSSIERKNKSYNFICIFHLNIFLVARNSVEINNIDREIWFFLKYQGTPMFVRSFARWSIKRGLLNAYTLLICTYFIHIFFSVFACVYIRMCLYVYFLSLFIYLFMLFFFSSFSF